MKHQGFLRRHIYYLLIFLLFMSATGCAKKQESSSQKSRGVDDGIGGFLFNFDQRDEVAELVRQKKRGTFPPSVTWYYEPGGDAREEDGEVQKNTRTSEDPDKIKDIYYALSNTIVVGIATDQVSFPHYFVSFTLPSGEECRFNFVSENTIRLSEQNYVVESDGNLWKALKME